MKSATGLVLTCVIFTLVLFVPEKQPPWRDSTGQTFAVEQEKVRRKENLFQKCLRERKGEIRSDREARPATGQFLRWRTDIINMLMSESGD